VYPYTLDVSSSLAWPLDPFSAKPECELIVYQCGTVYSYETEEIDEEVSVYRYTVSKQCKARPSARGPPAARGGGRRAVHSLGPFISFT